ncbi:MAG: preprotein translocase subunit YajC [Cytophagales bacterium]|jgi:preprotein translocase subunit YajC|nr:preprotein translocase subunit YajC [Cytophagales bacterium]
MPITPNVITLDVVPAAQPFDYSSLILFGFFIVVFYFFVIRPQKKRQAQQQNFLKNLKKGDSVVTLGGMCGKIFEIEGDKIILEVDDHGRKLTFFKNAVSAEYVDKKNQ